MEIEINKFNAVGESHGYWETDIRKSHFYNGLNVGLKITSIFRCHHLNGKEIGCEQYKNAQYFYNSKGNIFGEHIIWK